MKKHLEALSAVKEGIDQEIDERLKNQISVNHLRDVQVRLGTAIRSLDADIKATEKAEALAKKAADEAAAARLTEAQATIKQAAEAEAGAKKAAAKSEK